MRPCRVFSAAISRAMSVSDQFSRWLRCHRSKWFPLPEHGRGCAVFYAGAAAAVVAQHAAHHAAVAGTGIWPEIQSFFGQLHIQFIAHNARLNFYPTFFFVDFNNAGKVFRNIHHNALTHALTGQTCSRCTGNERDFMFLAKLIRAFISALFCRISNRQRFLLVNARIGAVEPAVETVKQQFAR
jgi:hypothetical protein